MSVQTYTTIFWLSLLALLCGVLLVRRQYRQLNELFPKRTGFSPVARWLLIVSSLFSLLILLHFATMGIKTSESENGSLPPQVWVAILDIEKPEIMDQARHQVREAAISYAGIPVSLYEVQDTFLELLVPPTFDQLYFNLILDTSTVPKSRPSASHVISNYLPEVHRQSSTPCVSGTIFTDRASQYGLTGQIGDFNIVHIELGRVQTGNPTTSRRINPPQFQSGLSSVSYTTQYLSLLLAACATILFIQGFRPKKFFVIALLLNQGLQAQNLVVDQSPILQSAELFYRQGDYQEARRILESTLKPDTENISPYLLWNLALCQSALGEFEKALGTISQLDREFSGQSPQGEMGLSARPIQQYIYFKLMEQAISQKNCDKLQEVIQQATAQAENNAPWLMLGVCALRDLQRSRAFSFSKVSSVLFSRMEQAVLAIQNSQTDKMIYAGALGMEIDAYSKLFSEHSRSKLTDLPMPMRFEKEHWDGQSMEEAVTGLDRFYLKAMYLTEEAPLPESWRYGVESLFIECVRASLWKNQLFIGKRREFLKAILSSLNLPVDELVSSSTTYEVAYEDLSLYRLLYPQQDRFYNCIKLYLLDQDKAVLMRAFSVMGLKVQSFDKREETKNLLLSAWEQSGNSSHIPSSSQAVSRQASVLMERGRLISCQQVLGSALLECLHLLLDGPKPDFKDVSPRAFGRSLLEQVLPFLQLAVSFPFDQDIASTLLAWFQAFGGYMDIMQFDAADTSLANAAEAAILEAANLMQAQSQAKSGARSSWNRQISVILEKVQLLYELLQDKQQQNSEMINNGTGDDQAASQLFDPVQLYKMLELRDRQLRESNMVHTNQKSG